MPDAECMTRELRVSVGLTAALVTATVVALLIVPPAQPLARSAGATNTAVAEAQAARSDKALLSHRVGVSIVSKQSAGTTFAWTVKRADRVWCSLDGGTAGKCSSPKAYPGLRSGRHSFVVSGWNKRTAESMMVTWTAGPARPHRAHTVSTYLRGKKTLARIASSGARRSCRRQQRPRSGRPSPGPSTAQSPSRARSIVGRSVPAPVRSPTPAFGADVTALS